MGDESSGYLEGKALSSLRVVDLKHELEKRGLSKSGSKKELVKRLKQKLELEKLYNESSAAGLEPRLQLDEATEQNEFVRQYLANQQKLYAQQKEVKRLIEQQEQGKGTEEEEDDDDDDSEDYGSDSGNKCEDSNVSESITVVKNSCDSSTSVGVDEEDEKVEQNEQEQSLTKSEPESVKAEPESSTGECHSDTDSSTVLKGDSVVSDPSQKMESATHAVAYSLSDIQLPDSPGSSHSTKASRVKEENGSHEDEGHAVLSLQNSTVDSKCNGSEAEGKLPSDEHVGNVLESSGTKHCSDESSCERVEVSEDADFVGQQESRGSERKMPEVSCEMVAECASDSTKEHTDHSDTGQDSVNQSNVKQTSPEVVPEFSQGKKSVNNPEKSLDKTKACDESQEEEKKELHVQKEKLGSSSKEYYGQLPDSTDDHTSPAEEDLAKDKPVKFDLDEKNTAGGAEDVESSSKEAKLKADLDQQESENQSHGSPDSRSSETEDGESKTDDEDRKSNKYPDSYRAPDKPNSPQTRPAIMKNDHWKDADTDSSSDSSSSHDGHSRRKSYRSSKTEAYFSSPTSKTSSKHTEDTKDAPVEKKQKTASESVSGPRRPKIKRGSVILQETSASEDKSSKKETSTSGDKSIRVRYDGTGRKSSPVSGIAKEEKSTKEALKSSTKKRPAEELPPENIPPAKVTYRKLNIPFKRSEEKAEQDQKEKSSERKRLWRSALPKTAVNISTDSLKTIIPDFKVVCAPSVNEVEEMPSLKVDTSSLSSSSQKTSKSYAPAPSQESLHEEIEVTESSSFKAAKKDQSKEDQEPKVNAENPKRTVLSKKPPSRILFIQNLVRPFTLLQLKEVLKRTGVIVEEEFWIDKIKSKCFVTYETEDQAEETREALHGTRWPPSNPKILSVDYSTKDEMEFHRNLAEQPKGVSQAAALLEKKDENVPPADSRKRKEREREEKEQRSKQTVMYIREWDKDKVTQEESPEKRSPVRDVQKSRNEKRKDKKDVKRKPEEDTPAKLLDDLFHKTKATPCIYWLPLTEEQVKEKEEQRRQRRLERERRVQEEERRARQRTRDRDTRSRSRSPVRRR